MKLQTYIDQGYLRAERVESLSEHQKKVLGLNIIYQLIRDGSLTIERALIFTLAQYSVFSSKAVCQLIENKTFTVEEVLTFGMWQKRALESKVIRSFIDSGCMTFKKAAELSDEQQNFLDLDVVRKLIQEGILPFDVALNLTWRQQQNLEVPMVVELLRSKDERCCLTLDQVLRLQWMALDNLKSKTVCALLQEGILPSVEKALSLAAEQRQSLELPIVAKLLRSKDCLLHLTLEQALKVRSRQEAMLESKHIHKLIKDGQITFEQALEFTYDQQSVCESDAIRALIQQGILSFDLSLKLTGCQQRNLEAPVIAELLRSKDQRCRLTLEQALALDSVQRDNIKSKTVRALLQEGILPSIEKALSLTEEQRRSLVRPTVGKLLRSKDHFLHLTLEQALNIKSEQELTLASKDIRQLIQDRQITLEQALAFTSEQQRSCESGVIRALVQEGILSFDLSLKLTGCQQRNLEEPRVAELLRSKDEHCRLTLDQALRLMSWHKEFLQSKLTFKLIKDKKLTMEQALTLSYNQKCGLDSGVIYTLFRDGHLSFDQIVRMTDHQRWSLQIRGVDSLIARQIISAERYFSLDNTQRQALQDEGMIRRILRNEIAINDVIGVPGRNRRNARNLNGVQSTHVASVHQSISESASALIGLYGKSLEGKGLILTLDQIKNYVNGLGYDIKSKAARSTLLKLILENNPFIDQVSGVSTKEVLALAWLAIHDDSKRLGALDDAKARFVEALYEIQRGYNIGSDGKDSGGKDKPICAAGSFNKIVAKLQGVHPSCEIMHVTPAVAALKLLVVVREEAVRYIMSRPLETKQDLVDFVTLLKNVDEEKIKSDKGSVSIIYGDIKNSIAERMLGEFGRFLYPGGKNNLSFQGLIDSGSDVDVPDINVLQKITDSAAYQKYFKGKTSDATEGALSDEEQQAKEYLDLQRLQGIRCEPWSAKHGVSRPR